VFVALVVKQESQPAQSTSAAMHTVGVVDAEQLNDAIVTAVPISV